MASARSCLAFVLVLTAAAACTSATDRLNEGVALQSQGRYIEAVYRYADAVERDGELIEAQERVLSAGDTAVVIAMDEADQLERRGDPVQAAGRYQAIDQMLARVRQVGLRIDVPADYSTIRRTVFDNAINWQMVRGDEAGAEGRWADARGYYQGARAGTLLPRQDQTEESLDAETRVLLDWAAVELEDLRPRSAYGVAQQAIEVRSSPARETVLEARDLQERALAAGTVVLAVVPVMAEAGVREWLGGEFEVQLDADLGLDHWNRPPLFVEMADPIVLRRELRGLLRGQAAQSPLVVGQALQLIGADLGVMIRLSGIDVVEEDVDRDEYETLARRSTRDETRRTTPVDTVTYVTLDGILSYYVEAEIVLVDPSGREVNRFTASSTQSGPFERGEFDGDPSLLELDDDHVRFFDPGVLGGQVAEIEGAVLEELAVAIAAGTFDQVLAGIR